MHRLSYLLAAAIVVALCAPALGGSDAPDLKGTWVMTAEGISHHKKPDPKAHTNVKTGQFQLDLTIIIDKQKGFRFSGTKESPKMKEKISGVVGFDNKTIYMVDDDGMMFCRLIEADKMEYVYLRVTHDFSAIGRAILTRKR